MAEGPLPKRMMRPEVQRLLETVDVLGPTSNAVLLEVVEALAHVGYEVIRKRLRRLSQLGVLERSNMESIGLGVLYKSRTAVSPGPKFGAALAQLGRVPVPVTLTPTGFVAADHLAVLWLLDAVANGGTPTRFRIPLVDVKIHPSDQLSARTEQAGSAPDESRRSETTTAIGYTHRDGRLGGFVARAGWLGPQGADMERMLVSTRHLGPVDLFVGDVDRHEEVAWNRVLVGHHGLPHAGKIVTAVGRGDGARRHENRVLSGMTRVARRRETLIETLTLIGWQRGYAITHAIAAAGARG